MKKNFLILLCFALFVGSCKKDDKNPPVDENALSFHELADVASNTRAKFIEFAPQTGGDPKLAIMRALDWLNQQPNVTNAFHVDSIYLFFEMTSGLTSMFYFNELDEDGYSKYRGGGSGPLYKITSGGGCSNVIENKNVLIYAPGWSEFRYGLSPVPDRLQNNDVIDQVDIIKDEEATYNAISTFSNYGLVLMETHGTPFSFMTGDELTIGQAEIPTDIDQFMDIVLNQLGNETYELITSGKLMLCSRVNGWPQGSNWWSNQQEFEEGNYDIHATAGYVQSLSSLSNTIVVGAFCYSGAVTPNEDITYPIGKAFKDKNPVSYYAFQRPDGSSYPVDSKHCIYMEDTLTRRLIIEGDSTGVAHLAADNSQFHDPFNTDLFFVNLGRPDWCYAGCDAPIVDQREQQVQVYKTVCIGSQTWMAENLNYSGGGAGVCYDNSSSNCDVLGRLYSINELTGLQVCDPNTPVPVQGICPEGWHVPSREDLDTLFDAIGGESMVDELKADSLWTGSYNDSYGFSMLPGGRWGSWVPGFLDLGVKNYLWTSSALGTNKYGLVAFTASGVEYYWQIEDNPTTAPVVKAYCRCVKDK